MTSLTMPLIVAASLLLGAAIGFGYPVVFAVLDRLNRTYADDLRDRMTQVGMELSWLPGLLRLRLTGAIAVFLILWLGLSAWPLGVMLAFFVYTLFPVVFDAIVENRRVKVRDQLVSAVREVANQTRAGVALERGMAVVSKGLPDPLGKLLWGAMAQCLQGRDFREVMLELKHRVRIDSMTLFVTVVLIARERGGDLAPVLDGIGHSLEETQRLERKRDTDTAAGRLVVNLLTGFPLLFLGITYAMDAETCGLVFSMIEGQFVLCGVCLLVYFSIRWARHILKRLE